MERDIVAAPLGAIRINDDESLRTKMCLFPFQNKIEHFIHSGLRRPMLMGHRQAWVWQDEWYGLTIDNIRHLEEETQRVLAMKMGRQPDHVISNTPSDRDSDQEVGFASEKGRGSVVYIQENNNSSKLELISKVSLDENEGVISPSPVAITVEKFGFESDEPRRSSHSFECNGVSQRDLISTADNSAGRLSRADILKGWHISTIEASESDSENEEFFDAQGT